MSERSLQWCFYVVLLLAMLAGIGAGGAAAGAEGLAFGLFASLTLGGSVVCIWERSVVRSAFALMATFVGVAGFFLLLGHDFLAMAQILIYVGGILALILFGVMLTPPDMEERSLPRIGLSLALVGGAAAFLWKHVASAVDSLAVGKAGDLAEPVSRDQDIGLAFLDPNQYVVAFELAAFLLTVALVAAVYIARRRAVDFQPEEQA